MGLFKGMKDLKDLSQHHGGMPSIRDSFKDIGALADDRGEKEVLKNGVVAKAVVKGFAEPVPGEKFAMHIPLEIHPPNGEPYVIDYVFPTARMKAVISSGVISPESRIWPSFSSFAAGSSAAAFACAWRMAWSAALP